MKVAVIDLGSNAVRMSFAEICGKNVNIVNQYRENVRLSEGMSDDCLLKEIPVKRTVEALTVFKDKAKSFGAEKIVAVATAAMRKAKNKEAVINPMRHMGIDLEIIDGLKEAYYDYIGVVNKLSLDNCLIVDLGGASTELIFVADGKCSDMISLPFGAVSLTEQYVKNQNNTDGLKEYIDSVLNDADFLNNVENIPIIALGGTARSFGQIDLNRKTICDTHKISMQRFFEIYEKICGMTAEEIRDNTPVEPKRADILYAGFTVINRIVKKICASEIVVEKSGVMEGVLYDIAR